MWLGTAPSPAPPVAPWAPVVSVEMVLVLVGGNRLVVRVGDEQGLLEERDRVVGRHRGRLESAARGSWSEGLSRGDDMRDGDDEEAEQGRVLERAAREAVGGP